MLVERLDTLQRRLAEQYGVALHYTGVRPVVELTGRLMVRDLRKLLPLVGAATVVILLLTFGGARGVLVALAVTVSAAAAGGALFVLLAGAGTPLLILAPVFAGGLFSDYAIHMGYHLGWRGDGSGRAARGYLRLPLTLTAVTTVIGFLALGGLGSTVHRFVAVTVSTGALAALALALWWMPAAGRLRAARQRTVAGAVARRIHRLLVRALLTLARHRVAATVLLALPVAVAAPQIGRLVPEPYPLHQLPAASTIVQAGGHLQPGVRGHGAVRGADRRRDGGRLPAPGGAAAPAHCAPDPGRTAGGGAPALAVVGGGAHPPLLRCRRGGRAGNCRPATIPSGSRASCRNTCCSTARRRARPTTRH